MALVQLNLKIPPEVAEAWRAAAAAAGHRSIRDWLVAITSTGPAAPAAAPDLLARVDALEAAVAALQRLPRSGGSPSPDRAMPPPPPAASRVIEARPDGALVSVDLARRLGITADALNRFAATKGPGAVHRCGWKVVGKVSASSGVDRWLWSPPEAG